MSAHTPGPFVYWCADRTCEQDNCYVHRGPYTVGDHGPEGGGIATCLTAELAADLCRRLNRGAAAPAMLAALELLLSQTEAARISGPYNAVLVEALGAARAAIASATGQERNHE